MCLWPGYDDLLDSTVSGAGGVPVVEVDGLEGVDTLGAAVGHPGDWLVKWSGCY